MGNIRGGTGRIERRQDIADDVAQVAGWVTPRHGSIGALTRAMLLKNLVEITEGVAG